MGAGELGELVTRYQWRYQTTHGNRSGVILRLGSWLMMLRAWQPHLTSGGRLGRGMSRLSCNKDGILLRLGLLLRLMLTAISTRTSCALSRLTSRLASRLTSRLTCKLRLVPKAWMMTCVAPPRLRAMPLPPAQAVVSQAWMRFGKIQISGPRSCHPRIPLHLLLLVCQLLLQLLFLQLLLQLQRQLE